MYWHPYGTNYSTTGQLIPPTIPFPAYSHPPISDSHTLAELSALAVDSAQDTDTRFRSTSVAQSGSERDHHSDDDTTSTSDTSTDGELDPSSEQTGSPLAFSGNDRERTADLDLEYPASSDDDDGLDGLSTDAEEAEDSDEGEEDASGEGGPGGRAEQEEETGSTAAEIFREHATAFGVSAHDALEVWAMEILVQRLDAEMNALISSDLLRVNANSLSWDAILAFSFVAVQAAFLSTAPLLWIILTTLSISPRNRQRPVKMTKHGKGGRKITRRNPWLVS